MNSLKPLSMYALVLALAAGCVNALPEDNRPCPCTDGWTCCAATQTCLAEGAVCPTDTPDTVPPATPVLRTTLPRSPSASTSVTLGGTSEAGARVEVFTTAACTGAPVATGSADPAGEFRIPVTLRPDATTPFHARATDAASNVSRCSAEPLSVRHDGVPPVPPTLTGLTPSALSNSTTSPLLSGDAEPGAIVQLFADADCLTALPFSATADERGAVLVWASVSRDSTTRFHARARDAAGNESQCSSAGLTFTHDGTAPSAPVLDGPAPLVNVSEPEARGTAEPGAQVTLFPEADCVGEPLGTGLASIEGTFTLRAPARRNTSNTLSARAMDAAGNASACSSARTFLHDDIPPISPWALTLRPGSPTNETTTPTLTGRAEPRTAVRVFRDRQCFNTAVTSISDAQGDFSVQVSVQANSLTWLSANTVDEAGNTSPCKEGPVFSHDSLPPAPPVLLGASEPSPSTAGTPFRVRGTAETGTRIQLYANATCTGPALAATTASNVLDVSLSDFVLEGVTASQESTTEFHATASDALGNASACASASLLHTRTAGRGWGPVERLDLNGSAVIASNSAGPALAVWWEHLPTYSLRARFATPEGGWGDPEVIAIASSSWRPQDLTVVVADTGHAFVAWSESFQTHTEARLLRFVPGKGWQPMEVLRDSATALSAYRPMLGVDAAGTAHALWTEYEPEASGSFLRVSRSLPQGGWEAPHTLRPGAQDLYDTQLAVAPNGDAWVFGSERAGAQTALWGSHYTAAKGWSAAERHLEGHAPSGLHLAADGANGAFLAWAERDVGASTHQVWVRHFVPGTGWDEPRQLAGGSEGYASVRVVTNARGDALVAWVQRLSDRGLPDPVWASHYSAETGWSPTARLQRPPGFVGSVIPALGATGEAMVAWEQTAGARAFPYHRNDWRVSLWMARFESKAGWSQAQLLADEPRITYRPFLWLEPRGEARALWSSTSDENPSASPMDTRRFR
ncbi:Ig-like domain-containing protein [Myxococcaceae bacterium GXIMD 01537]